MLRLRIILVELSEREGARGPFLARCNNEVTFDIRHDRSSNGRSVQITGNNPDGRLGPVRLVGSHDADGAVGHRGIVDRTFHGKHSGEPHNPSARSRGRHRQPEVVPWAPTAHTRYTRT